MVTSFSLLIKRFSSILFLFLIALIFSACGAKKTIVHDLPEKDANEIIVFLANKNVPADKEKVAGDAGGGGRETLWNIVVDETYATEAISILNMYGLPRRRSQNLLEIFSKGGLVPSEMEEKIKYQSGLAVQIASTIRKIDGVLDAEVQLSIPPEDPLHPEANKQKVSASVYIKHSGVLDDPNSQLITKIRRLVASSIPGLEYDNVTIIPDRARFIETPYKPQEGQIGATDITYTKVWGLILAQESVTKFRLIFFSFIFLLIILITALFWLIWKISHALGHKEGLKQLFSFKPLHLAQTDTNQNKEEAENEENDKTPKDEGNVT